MGRRLEAEPDLAELSEAALAAALLPAAQWPAQLRELEERCPDAVAWLVSRRADELTGARLFHRQRGELMVAVAMAVARGELPYTALYGEVDNPFEDPADVNELQACLAVAYGAAPDEDERNELLGWAVRWTAPDGLATHRDIGTAALVAEVRRGGELASLIREGVVERLEMLLAVLGDEDSEIPPERAHASLEATLAVLCATLDDAEVDGLMGRFPGFEAEVALAWARAAEPGPKADARIVSLVRAALSAGDATGPRALVLLEDVALASELVVELLGSIDADASDELVMAAIQGCGVVSEWPTIPAAVRPQLLALVTRADLHPGLREAAARALGSKMSRGEPADPILVSALREHAFGDDRLAGLGAIAALLHLGDDDPQLTAYAGLHVADGAPAPLFVAGLVRALKRAPKALLGIAHLLQQQDAPAEAARELIERTVATLAAAGADPADIDLEARRALVNALSPTMEDLNDPVLAGRAAYVVGWLGRGVGGVQSALLTLRQLVEGHERASVLFDLALGAAGGPPEALSVLVEDTTRGNPELAAAGARGLAVFGDRWRDYNEAVIVAAPHLVARAGLDGPQQDPLRRALLALATKPL